jgi:hypothetical protein
MIHFSNGTNQSDGFQLVQLPITDLASLELKMQITLTFPIIAAFAFVWEFANPVADQCLNVSRLLLAFLTGDMLLISEIAEKTISREIMDRGSVENEKRNPIVRKDSCAC